MPGRVTTNALTACPFTASGTPTTATSAAAPCWSTALSISNGPIRYPGALDDIVGTTFKPEIAVLVPSCEIAGANPVATIELLRRRVVVPVSQPIAAAVVGPLSDQPDRFRRQLLARLVDDRHALSGRRKPHRAGLHLHRKAIVVADRQSEFCGSEMIHRNDAPGISKEIHDFRIQRLAATRYRPNRRSEISYRLAARHQAPQHRRRCGQVGHACTDGMMSRQTSGVAFASTHKTGMPIANAGR